MNGGRPALEARAADGSAETRRSWRRRFDTLDRRHRRQRLRDHVGQDPWGDETHLRKQAAHPREQAGQMVVPLILLLTLGGVAGRAVIGMMVMFANRDRLRDMLDLVDLPRRGGRA